MVNSSEIVLTEINRQVTSIMYNEYVDVDVDLARLLEIISTLQGAMHRILNEADCWKMAVACSSMWVNIHDVEMLIVCFAISNAYCASTYHGK